MIIKAYKRIQLIQIQLLPITINLLKMKLKMEVNRDKKLLIIK